MFKFVKGREEKILYFFTREVFRIYREELRKTFYLFGKKIYRTRKINGRKVYLRLMALETMFKATTDIKNYLPARGVLRDIQLIELKMLKEIDSVCRENQLTYWIDFGTLLGAVRHQGFIPWDDDADISMPREDYNKFLDLFNKDNKNPQFHAVLQSHQEGKWNMIKVIHKTFKSISIDVFACDYCYRTMDDQQKLAFSKKIKSLTVKHSVNIKNLSTEAFHNSFLQLRDDHITDLQQTDDIKPTLFFGCEFHHTEHHYSAFDYDVIFPLSEIKFEDTIFPAVHKPDIYLTYLYRDYLQVPRDVNSHLDISTLSTKELIDIRQQAQAGVTHHE